jgi:hypothetical protein
LREVYEKVTISIELGLFDGTSVQAHGTLYNEAGDEVADICWHQYSDEDSTEGGLLDTVATHGAPVTLQ